MSAGTKTLIQAPITITPSALAALKQIRANQNISEEHALRVGVKGGGCSGFSYILGFDLPKEGDSHFEIEGLRGVMQKSHGLYLLGIEIDWQDGLNNRGFTFTNPNATDTCGCGSSFSA